MLTQAQQKYESNILPAKRGDIYDRNGNILATSNKVYNVILDCKAVNSEEGDYVEPTVRALTEVSGAEMKMISGPDLPPKRPKTASIRSSRNSCPWMTRRTFDEYTTVTEDSDLSDEQKEERSNVKGVWFEEDYLRSYPFNDLACDTIGFTLARDTADVGLESYYNSTLTGADGRQYGYINDDSDVEQTIIDPSDGESIVTSLDVGAQQIVEKYVNGFKTKMGAKNIGVDCNETFHR